MRRSTQLRQILRKPWIPNLLSLLGGIYYFTQSWVFAHTRDSILDEGAYLYKGLLFVQGKYTLYQDYGPWSNHMPLAFYLPGLAQLLFGPGIRTGRYLAIAAGILFLIGLWVLARRLGGSWWAAAAVWIIAINPAMIKMYSVLVSQVFIACLLVWTLVLVLGEGRSLLQISLGAALAGLTMLIRINLVPIIPLLVVYVFWQHGRKAGLLAALTSGLIIGLGHALFWPGILRIWAYWLPDAISPFLDPWRPPTEAYPSWDPEIGLSGRVASFFMSFRVNFLALAGVMSTLLLWPRKDQWKKPADLRSAVLLAGVFLTLLLAHMWATLTKNYCVYCLPGYTTFFSAAGLALIILSITIWRRQLAGWHQALIAIAILLLCTGIGYGAWDDLARPLYELPIPKFFLGYSISSGSVQLGELLRTLFPLNPQQLRRLLPMGAGFLAGAFILFMALSIKLASSIRHNRYNGERVSFGYLSVLILLLGGTLLSPSLPFGGGYEFLECSADTIRSYEEAGKHLARLIPPGSRVYWRGGLSAVPLLYLPEIEIYPPQINGTYTYYKNGDSDALLRYGFWNEELAKKWANEADYILIQPRFFQGWLKNTVKADKFEELEPTPPTVACREAAEIRIFRRKP